MMLKNVPHTGGTSTRGIMHSEERKQVGKTLEALKMGVRKGTPGCIISEMNKDDEKDHYKTPKRRNQHTEFIYIE